MTDTTRIETLLTRYGRNVHSFMVLEPDLKYWFSSGTEGGVAYTDRGGYWIAVGAPLGPESERVRLGREFFRAAAAHGRKAAFFGVSERFFGVEERVAFDRLKIAEQPLWDPSRWTDCLRSKLRNRIRRSRKEGVEIESVPVELLDRGEVNELLRSWESSHSLPPMKFMVQMDLFGHSESRFYLTARKKGELVGLAVAVPIYGLDGWLLEDLLVDRGAGHGVSEALIDRFMTEAANRHARTASLGMVPLAGLDSSEHPLLTVLMKASRRLFRGLYDARGLRRFRRKLNPHRWESVYLVTPQPLDFWALRAVLMAFTGGWVPRYAWRALKRRTCPAGRTCCA